MKREYDLVIRGGTIVDGTGGDLLSADIAIRDGQIATVGKFSGAGDEEIDASGRLVTPGFVDVHTHYDGQAIWSGQLTPSSNHGVTTVVMGNCGVGFAPCRAEDRERLIQLMEGVEDIPGVVMSEGLSWDWESYPEYLDAIEARQHDINLASFLPHSALRIYVMGKRASIGQKATPEDLGQMFTLTREAIKAGALGFATSRTLFHRSINGEIVPTCDAGEEELTAIASAMQSEGQGILQIANDFKNFTDLSSEFDLMERIVAASKRPLSLPLAQIHSTPEMWRGVIKRIEEANARGVEISGQAMPRGVGMLLGLELTMHPFVMCPSYAAIAELPLDQRLMGLRTPQMRERLISEEPADPSHPLVGFVRNFNGMFEAGDPIDYEPNLEDSITQRAERMGVQPEELAYDILIQGDGRSVIFLPFANYAYGNLDAVGEMLGHKYFVPGLGDGGAHCGVICDASYSTFMLTHWTRDRKRGNRFGVAQVIKALCSDTADMVGLKDRGILAPGFRADVNVIDYDNLQLHAPNVVYDLPKGGRRLMQKADGYVATIVNGKIVYREGSPTGLLPGQLIRGAQQRPT